MSFWRNLVRRLGQEPYGQMADGRRLGMVTAAAADARRRVTASETVESRRRMATEVATDCRHRMDQPEHGHHPG